MRLKRILAVPALTAVLLGAPAATVATAPAAHTIAMHYHGNPVR